MKIKILFFGITTDFIGTSELQIDVTKNTSVEELKSILKKQFPKLENINSYAIAVNEEYATNKTILKESDIVAVIPPVSGG